MAVRADDAGRYRLAAPAGVHALHVEAGGHLALDRVDVRVAPDATAREDIGLAPEAPSEELVAMRLAALEAGRLDRDRPDDPGLRPEVAAFLRGERASLPSVRYDVDPAAPSPSGEVGRAAQALVGMCGASLPRPPATIRIWRRSLDGSTASCRGRVDRIPFEDYVKGVLPHEWIPSWHRESLRAGSLAIRTYSWRWVLAGGKYDCADLDDTTASQVYRSDRMAVTSAAVDATRAQGIVRGGRLVTGEYSAENADPTADGVSEPLCRGRPRFGHGRGMCQWGSSRWASAGRDHVWIARHYWPGSSIGCGGDSDADGVADDRDNCPRVDNAGQADADRDRRGDARDNCPREDNPTQADVDRDGMGDACDDGDGDGVLDAADNCPRNANRDQEDLDEDRAGDACDADDDGDSAADATDNCPREANADQRDDDGDGRGDACDDDRDGDGVIDGADNCPDARNADQRDADDDGLGDACDPTPTAPRPEDGGFVRTPEDAGPLLDGGLTAEEAGGGCGCRAAGRGTGRAGPLGLAWVAALGLAARGPRRRERR